MPADRRTPRTSCTSGYVVAMAAWRSPDLEAIFNGPLDEGTLGEASLQQLVRASVRETDQLDFKGAMYHPTKGPRPSWTDEQAFAKDIAAFANHRGGAILIGVQETNDIATSLAPVKGLVFAGEV